MGSRRSGVGRLPLRKSLLGRLLLISALVALCSVAATAWLAVQTTSGAIRQQQGRLHADDSKILDSLTGYAATHSSWDGVDKDVRDLAQRTGRRIALTTEHGKAIADSAAEAGRLPPRASAVVDPLTLGGDEPIHPRAVGPFRLPDSERDLLKALAQRGVNCLTKQGLDTSISTTPSGRPTVRILGNPAGTGAQTCPSKALNDPTATEAKALATLDALLADCLAGTALTGVHVNPDFTWRTTEPGSSDGGDAKIATCLTEARQKQLRPYVAPSARLFLTGPETAAGMSDTKGFTLSPGNTARIAGVAALVLTLTVGVSVLASARLIRPLRALTDAAQRMRDGGDDARVLVRGDDEIGRLTAAFNEMSEQRARLEDQRRAMVGDIAHELRTPLSNIRGWLEAAEDKVAAPDEDFITSLLEEAVLLQHVIDDLQDLAAADAGELRLHPEPVDTGDLLGQVAAAHRARAEAAGVSITTDVPRGDWLTGDPVRLRQVVGNLASNALRHTERGGCVTLTCKSADGRTMIEVADTGSGIAPEDLPYLFDRFWRAEKSRSRRTGGSGLGLAIVRKLTEAHGGTVTARSEVGRGSVFTLRLPRDGPPAAD